MIGADKPIDTQRYFVVCINSLGSCFGSTGPASVNPSTGKVYRLDFPVLTVEDIANSAIPILAHLDVEQVHTVVGASMGGMTALSFALMHPERCSNVWCPFPLAAAASPTQLRYDHCSAKSLEPIRCGIRAITIWLNMAQ